MVAGPFGASELQRNARAADRGLGNIPGLRPPRVRGQDAGPADGFGRGRRRRGRGDPRRTKHGPGGADHAQQGGRSQAPQAAPPVRRVRQADADRGRGSAGVRWQTDGARGWPQPRGNHYEERKMNWDRIEGNWKQFKGNAMQQWGKLTNDHLDVIAGKRDLLLGRIQELYGISKDETEKQLADWQKRME